MPEPVRSWCWNKLHTIEVILDPTTYSWTLACRTCEHEEEEARRDDDATTA
jgi:hypothetical protein